MKVTPLFRILVIAALLVGAAAGAAWAHDVLYQGTVLAVESTKVYVKTVEEKSKKEENIWFTVTRETKVKRGEKPVAYADAKIADGERIVVVVNHDAKVQNVATELRLAAR